MGGARRPAGIAKEFRSQKDYVGLPGGDDVPGPIGRDKLRPHGDLSSGEGLALWENRITISETGAKVIKGTHVVIYTKDSEADRAFFRDTLKFPCVDAGHGWLIFAMPPLEAAFHDSEKNGQHELFLMCDDIRATLSDLKSKNVEVSEVSEQRWGKLATFTLPGGGKIGIYEPKHPSPSELKR